MNIIDNMLFNIEDCKNLEPYQEKIMVTLLESSFKQHYLLHDIKKCAERIFEICVITKGHSEEYEEYIRVFYDQCQHLKNKEMTKFEIDICCEIANLINDKSTQK